jgi:hypothetical protein
MRDMAYEKREPPSGAQLYKLVQGLLSHDEVIARCVLGVKNLNLLKDEKRFHKKYNDPLLLIEWMGNLLTVAGAFLYAKFNKWRTETGAHPDDKERPNSIYLKRMLAGIQKADPYFKQVSSGLRVLRVLDGLYNNYDMNLLVIKYIIINSQIEGGKNNDNEHGLSKLIGFPNDNSFHTKCDPLNKFKVDGYNLAEAFNFIYIYRNDPYLDNRFDDIEKYNPDDIQCAFEDVLCTMDFMKKIKLEIDPEGNVNFRENDKEILSHGIVRIFEKKEKEPDVYKSGMNLPKENTTSFYLLERIEYFFDDENMNSALKFTYQTFDEKESVSVYFKENDKYIEGLEDCDFEIKREKSAVDCFKKISGYLPGTHLVSSFFRGMITTHYRYHNILAPAIVDTIDEIRDIRGAKARILEKFVRDNENTFKEELEPTFKTLEFALKKPYPEDWGKKIDKLCEFISDKENHFRRVIDWDTLIARILIYEGPSETVKTIIFDEEKKDYRNYDEDEIIRNCNQIIAGLEMRYIDKIFDAYTVSEYQNEYYKKMFEKKINELELIYPDSYTFKMKCKARVQSCVDTIVNKLTKIEEQEKGTTSSNKFSEYSIYDTLEILDSYKNEKKNINTYKAFIRIIKAFLSFYAGIYKSCQSRMSYEFEKNSSILSEAKVKEKQAEIEKDFLDGAINKATELSKIFRETNASDAEMEEAVKKALIELWAFANKLDDVKFYHAILARAPINGEKLKEIFYLKNNKDVFFTVFSEEKRKLIDIPFGEAMSKGKKAIECLEMIIKFLAGGDLSDIKEKANDKDYSSYKEYVKKAIYPQVVTFAKHRRDCDKNECIIMNQSGAFADWHNGEVQILTEFEYKINQSYYALPNLNRSEPEWWVEPILVSCYKFDEEMDKISNRAGDTK